MNNPVCAACGHVNRVSAVVCEACDAPLYADETPGAGPFGETREPFHPSGEPSWAASDASEPGGGWAPETPADDIPAPPFKTAGDVISPMLAVYRKHFVLVGTLVLVAMVPEALLQFGLIGFMRAPATLASGGIGSASGGGGFLAFAAVSGVVLWLLTIACASLLSGSLVYAVVDLQRAGHSAAGECLRRGLKVLPTVLLVTILHSIVTGFGFLLLVVPGIILSLMFAVCVPAGVIERLNPIDALRRSHELTKGYKGLIFITYFLWGVLVFGLNWLIAWSFRNNADGVGLGLLPTLLVQTAVLGMLNSTLHVLTVYAYLGLLRERRSGFNANTFTPGPGVAV